jgi:hypothetical protein
MKSIDKLKNILAEMPKSKITQSSNYIWICEVSFNQNSKLCVKIEKNGSHVTLAISEEKPGLLKGKYPCIECSLIKRLEQIEGAKKSLMWIDYFDIELDSLTHIEQGSKRFYPKPKYKKKRLYNDEEVVEMIKNLIIKN